MKLDYMRLYVHDFHGSPRVSLLTGEEQAQYLLMLVKAWQLDNGCSLPADEEKLRRLLNVKKIFPNVLKLFERANTKDGAVLRNKRQFKEWNKAKAAYRLRSERTKDQHKKKQRANAVQMHGESTDDAHDHAVRVSLSLSSSEALSKTPPPPTKQNAAPSAAGGGLWYTKAPADMGSPTAKHIKTLESLKATHGEKLVVAAIRRAAKLDLTGMVNPWAKVVQSLPAIIQEIGSSHEWRYDNDPAYKKEHDAWDRANTEKVHRENQEILDKVRESQEIDGIPD